MKKIHIIWVVLLMAVLMPSAFGTTILVLENPGTSVFKQTENSPCIYDNSSCSQPSGFDATLIPVASSYSDLNSPVYTASQITGVVGSQFMVGIDVNTTGGPTAVGPEALVLFQMWVDGSLAAEYSVPAGTLLAISQNAGNGESDSLLKGFDLTGVAGTTEVYFNLSLINGVAGREQFFLISANGPPPTPQVPEPGTLGLLLSGLSILGYAVWRKRKA